ncbi:MULTISPECIES: mechanosensitive ion channel family protein [Paraclostridium]|uniref:Mechanosensitive ion channel n=1 Tax=Paraclostridium bifermentans TaxID=1490 RepID=A0AA44DPB8_PARBF|nr:MULTISPECIES: mechanosensitive ion channel domain-containing protein [Paraclostridium]MDV8116437.1 mechanosensitive ion channel [Bacillus sp. BAU-SS-2023]MBN8049532.1 mechanosensitive ion channel [Paraclostridium bifermentans]MBZ6007604.1 mechanosensitive ion channel [Paraclostridium bifermentans]MDU0297689.1 mechanosensitive ion channel [Paraclostridium sp. MRS3W1]NME11233.1 mechanosensitive ion channel [Paraclostridium bifermentans]
MISGSTTQVSQKTIETFFHAVKNSGPKLIYAIIFLIVGLYACKWLKRYSKNIILKYNVERGVANFASYAIYGSSVLMVIMTCLDIINFPVQSFMTVMVSLIGVIGLSLGLAFKEILSNLGAGMIILFFQPFKTGDYIGGSGVEGTVADIQIFSTILKTPDNKAIIVPNFKLTSDNIINYTHQEKRRIDFSFSVSYDTNIKVVKDVLAKIFKEDNRILRDPEPIIGLNTLGENAMQIVARPWVKTDDYWSVYFDVMEKVKSKFDENNIEIPFPSRVIYYKNCEEDIKK